MRLKKIIIILLLIVTLPLVLYTVFEFSSLNDSERIIADIYNQEMNSLLSTINQNTSSLINQWAEQLDQMILKDDKGKRISDYFSRVNGVEAIFIADSLLAKIEFVYSHSQKIDSISLKKRINDRLNMNKDIIHRMLYRKSVGYVKPESFNFIDDTTGKKYTVVLTVTDLIKPILSIYGIIINVSELSIFSTLPLNRYENTEVDFGIFDRINNTTIYSTRDLKPEDLKITSKIWLLNDYYMGIRLKDWAPEKRAKERFWNGVKMFLFLYLFLIAGVVFVYISLKKEMALAQMKSDFVSNVSHELRTPLALIRMFAETLSMDRVKTEKKKHEYYDVITGETERLSHLVNNILDFSKMESGKKKFQFDALDINEIVEKTLNTYKFHLENKGFKYTFEKFGESLIISGDKQSVVESFINLLENAIKYSKDKKEIFIRTGEEKRTVWFEVEDKGVGILAADQNRIFEKFFRVSTGLVHDVKGSGLGLALVDYIMKAHHGEIVVSGKLGVGSKFRLIFPKIVEKKT